MGYFFLKHQVTGLFINNGCRFDATPTLHRVSGRHLVARETNREWQHSWKNFCVTTVFYPMAAII